MTQQEKEIYEQIGKDNYSFWDTVKLKGGAGKLNNGGTNHPVAIRKSPESQILYRAKFNAKERNYDFNLTIEDINIPERCPYLDVLIETDLSKNNSDNYYSIDRIDSTKGYVKGNVQIISRLANTMKNKATKKQLILFSKNILKMYDC
jgi:hypothetical protein